nr:MAG TPA: hypothetical protein [Caudoviricetes sp.]
MFCRCLAAFWDIAQLVEHLSYTQQVPGSIPGVPITPTEVYLSESITADGRLISRRLGGLLCRTLKQS